MPGRRAEHTQPLMSTWHQARCLILGVHEREEQGERGTDMPGWGWEERGRAILHISMLIGRTSSSLEQRRLRTYTFLANFLSTLTNDFSSFHSV